MKYLSGEDQIVKLIEGHVGEHTIYLGVKNYLNKILKLQAIQLKSQWI